MKNDPLKDFTNEQLRKELIRREKIRRGPIKGYRAICYGDEYDYGGYTDFMIGSFDWWKKKNRTKKDCKKAAEEYIKTQTKHGGSVEEIYKNTPKPGKIH